VRHIAIGWIILGMAVLIAACSPTPTPVPTPTPIPTATATAEPTATPARPSAEATPGGIDIALSLVTWPEGDVVAKVNGVSILTKDYEDRLRRQLRYITQNYAVDWNDPRAQQAIPTLQAQVLDQLIAMEVLRQAADVENIEITAEDIQKELENVRAQVLASPEYGSWEEFLEKDELTEDEVLQMVADSLLVNRMLEAHGGSTEVEQVHARHILVEDEETGREVLRRLAAGESFADLAAEYSIDPGSKDKGGDLGWFPRGRMVPEFEQAAFSLDVGETSELVQTQFGYHIILVEEKGVRELDPESARQMQEANFSKWLSAQRSQAEVETFLPLPTPQ